MKLSLFSGTVAFFSLVITAAEPRQIQEAHKLEFEASMGLKPGIINLKNRVLPLPQAQAFLGFLKALYILNHPSTLQKSKKTQIPLKIHQIWLGPASPPALFASWKKTINDLHPGWEYILWTDKDIESLNLYNQALYHNAKNYGERSDIARYEILYRFGGVYLDIDFECIKSLKDLHYLYDFYTAILPLDCRSSLTNGVIGSIPGHPILRECIISLASTKHLKTILERTGPQHFEKSFWKIAPTYKNRSIAFPASFFFPLNKFQGAAHLTPEQIRSLIKPETFTIHHWTGTWTEPAAQLKS